LELLTHLRLRLAPMAARLAELLGQPVASAPDCVGSHVAEACSTLAPGNVLMLENLRFHKQEEKNDPDFAAALVRDSGAQIFVNDAFGTAHRAHASTAGVTSYVEHSVAGLLLQKELQYMNNAVLSSPKRPLVAIVGGSKVSSKLPVLTSLVTRCDTIIIGGAMCFTFLKALGHDVGTSMVEEAQLDIAGSLLRDAEARGVKLLLPSDAVVAAQMDPDSPSQVARVGSLPTDMMGLDIGPESIDSIREALAGAGTVVWNGPMGVFEMAPFAKGTLAVAEMLADLTDRGCTSIIGGGDSVAAVEKAGVARRMSHISTGGGASLELLEGKVLPGVAALDDA